MQKVESKLSEIPENKAVDQQYRFQPIRPPSASMSNSVRNSIDNGNNISISPIRGPSPAFNPQKLSNLADSVDFAQMPLKNPGMEGTSNSNVSLELAQKSDIAAPAPVIDKQGSTIFGVLLKQKDKENHLHRQVGVIMFS